MRMILWGFVCIFSMFVISCGSVTTSGDKIEVDLNLTEEELAYTYFDLQNGEATLIQSGKGGNVLIGTGEKSSEKQLARRLEMFQVKAIDSLILINNQPEYIGNVDWVLKNYPVHKVIVPEHIEEEMKSRFALSEQNMEGWSVDVKKELLPGLTTEVLYAGDIDYLEKAFILSFQYGKQKTLYMGLANEEIENQLTQKYPLKSAILKVADFGSPMGTSQPFLEEVDPQVAILFNKSGILPSETVLERLQETWIDIYQTSKNGTISIKFSDNDYQILTVHADDQERQLSIQKK